jgi:ParB family transcriptional regulator, chromosome partitioning protein
MSALVQPIISIPLNKLVPWKGNVRKTGVDDGIEELRASIAAHGVLQSLIVKKHKGGKFAVVAGQRRHRVLSALADEGAIASDVPVPCHVMAAAADAKEISLTENVVRAPMHPADQFEAFSALAGEGATPADIAARFGMSETAVKQRLKLARVSPAVFQAYKDGELTLEQVQAFTVSDDHAAQDAVFAGLAWNRNPSYIRNALTQDDIRATDKRARFVTVAAYEEAGGAVRRDLFAEDDEGVFLLDGQLLDRLALEKLKTEAETVKAEGWQWVEPALELDRPEMDFRVRRPDPLPLSEETQAERERLDDEYNALFGSDRELDEEESERLDAIEQRIAELEDREVAYSPEVMAIAGAIVTLDSEGGLDVLRGLVRPEDEPESEDRSESSGTKERPEFSAKLTQSLTAAKSAAIGAALTGNHDVALAAVVHALALSVFNHGGDTRLEVRGKVTRYGEDSNGADELSAAHESWSERIPTDKMALLAWCLEQKQETLLDLLAFCAGCTVNAVQAKQDSTDDERLQHANALASALKLDMTQWFTPTAENYFSRVGRQSIVKAITEATGKPAKRSWEKLKKTELAALAERETAGTGWLPSILRA